MKLKPTMNLRFVKRIVEIDTEVNVLQQEFEEYMLDEDGNGDWHEYKTGHTIWQDVPLVKEEE